MLLYCQLHDTDRSADSFCGFGFFGWQYFSSLLRSDLRSRSAIFPERFLSASLRRRLSAFSWRFLQPMPEWQQFLQSPCCRTALFFPMSPVSEPVPAFSHSLLLCRSSALPKDQKKVSLFVVSLILYSEYDFHTRRYDFHTRQNRSQSDKFPR